MQIAKVVPNLKTSDEGIFDYAIPPELLPQIQEGILVEVPFHGRNVEGIIVDIKRSSQIPNLKPILKFIDPIPVIDIIHIELAKWMSDYYIAPFGKALFENIVPAAKKSIKNISLQTVQHKLARANLCQKYLLIGDFNARLSFYLKAIDETWRHQKATIILVPDLIIIPYLSKNIKKSFTILHSKMTKTQRWLAWNNIRSGKTRIVIGSQSALFAPVSNLGLIIIDQEENETYKNGRTPRYHASATAKKLCELTGANLILGSRTPRLETYYNASRNKYRLITKQNSRTNITIIDMNSEKYIISNALESAIEKSLQENKKILLVY